MSNSMSNDCIGFSFAIEIAVTLAERGMKNRRAREQAYPYERRVFSARVSTKEHDLREDSQEDL
jgi:hypothetical protein